MSGKMPAAFLLLFFISATLPVAAAAQAGAQARSTPSQKAARYVCPMHREVTSEKPAGCPKCGMALRLVEDKNDAGVKPAGDRVAPETKGTPSISALRGADIRVYDQHGNQKNFYADLIKGKTVAINFIFTTCTTICPPLTATFRRVQKDLAERSPGAQLVSISVDPVTDTTERLRDFAQKFGVEPGWTFVTGEKAKIESLLQALGAAVADKNSHTPMIIILNDATGYWTRAYGLSSPAALVKMISEAAGRK